MVCSAPEHPLAHGRHSLPVQARYRVGPKGRLPSSAKGFCNPLCFKEAGDWPTA